MSTTTFHVPSSPAPSIRRWLTLLGMLAALTLIATACGGGDDTSDGTGGSDESPATESATTSETATSETATEAPDDEASDKEPGTSGDAVVRLTRITYQGLPSYEFTYGPAGEPVSHTVFHPVTGDPVAEYVVEEVDDAGNITEFSINELDTGTTATERNTYDDQGRLTSQTYVSESGAEQTSTYTYEGTTVTMENASGTIVYQLDAAGNITQTASTFSGPTTVRTNIEFDDVPNPRTMTGGMLIEMMSTNNAIRWSPDAGCEYTEEFTYDDDLLVASHAEGCGFTHDFTYEYTEF